MKIADMHCDTLYESLARQRKNLHYSMRNQDTQITFEKMKNSGYILQNFAAFVDMGETNNPLEEALHMIDLFYEQVEENRDIIAPVRCWKDIENNMASGKMSALLTLEEGGICKGNPAFLSILYRLGARMMTLTWNYENELGWPNFDMRRKRNLSPDKGTAFPDKGTDLPDKYTVFPDNCADSSNDQLPGDRFFEDLSDQGLKEQGIFFLEEMERLGIIIDVSHLSDAGFYDVLKYTKKPFVASHSNARTVCSAMRNLTDDMIRRLAERGGITGINFCNAFLGIPGSGVDYIDQVVHHMKYLVNLGGEDFVGLGSDFDGIEPYDDIKDCTLLPKLIDRMEKADFSYTQIEKICYKNVLRVYKELLS